MNPPEIATIAASGTVVAGGIGAFMRVIFKAVIAVRDNTVATKNLSDKVQNLSNLGPTIDRLDARLTLIEAKLLTEASA